MNEKVEKIFVGNGTEKFEGNMVAVNLCVSDIPKEHLNEFQGKKYLKLNVTRKREVDQYGRTHYVEIDQFKPKKEEAVVEAKEENKDVDLPF